MRLPSPIDKMDIVLASVIAWCEEIVVEEEFAFFLYTRKRFAVISNTL